MSDIVERLRRKSKVTVLGYAQSQTPILVADGPIMQEAADEIERLRAALDGRDDFLVSRGLWEEFVAGLEKPPQQEQRP